MQAMWRRSCSGQRQTAAGGSGGMAGGVVSSGKAAAPSLCPDR